MEEVEKIIKDIDSVGFAKKIVLSEAQTAKVLGVSPCTLMNWRRDGVGPSYKKMYEGKKGKVLYTKHAIAEWLTKTIKTA